MWIVQNHIDVSVKAGIHVYIYQNIKMLHPQSNAFIKMTATYNRTT